MMCELISRYDNCSMIALTEGVRRANEASTKC